MTGQQREPTAANGRSLDAQSLIFACCGAKAAESNSLVRLCAMIRRKKRSAMPSTTSSVCMKKRSRMLRQITSDDNYQRGVFSGLHTGPIKKQKGKWP